MRTASREPVEVLLCWSLCHLSEEREIIEERCFDGMTNVDSPYYLANSKEVPRPILSSKPRPDNTAMYSKRAESQENFIDCISPLFCSRP